MSSQASNGRGLVMLTGLLEVGGGASGAAVERSCTPGLPGTPPDGVCCHTITTAITSALNAVIRRSLVSMPLLASARSFPGSVQVVAPDTAVKARTRSNSPHPLLWNLVTSHEPTPSHGPTLWAISDLHTGHMGNKPVTESLHPVTAGWSSRAMTPSAPTRSAGRWICCASGSPR